MRPDFSLTGDDGRGFQAEPTDPQQKNGSCERDSTQQSIEMGELIQKQDGHEHHWKIGKQRCDCHHDPHPKSMP